MSKPYYLIDFENVQPKALDRLKAGESRIKVFLGQQQTKLMLDLVQALQPFGADAEYIPISGSGPDAVDFHIAFYIGQLSVADPSSTFRIISKDKGFDPLVRHLNARGIACQRLADIPLNASGTPSGQAKSTATPAKKAASKKKPAKKVVVTVDPAPPLARTQTSATVAQVKVVLACLAKSTKPSKVSGLRASIKSWFKPPLDDKAVDAVLQSLQSSKKITVAGSKVAYAIA
ncbi:hypothetical protein GXB84_07920 [Stenotrophomonas acidaminiphila]|uniref:PIN domain-containing protein n=1 Tax=Stenotrophomonas acidaminiphila TaxID=128780 RepID=UPI00137631B6|nr:PIN domain-containing protein [Stenotrophomonas acidaminiphila]NCT87252.1 hypothetical protein [Stenotrophomonas acidaminiphila]